MSENKMEDFVMDAKEMLKYAVENGIIDTDTIRRKIEMNERKKYLEKHTYETWTGKDGKYYTYLSDQIKGRKLVKRSTKESLENAIIEHYKKEEKEPYISNLFELWISSKLKYGEISEQTAQRYQREYNRFFKGNPFEKMKVRYITEDMLEDFIKSNIHQLNLTSKAWGNLRTLLKGMFKLAKKKGYTKLSISQFLGDLDLSSKIFRQTYKSNDELVFTKEELIKIENLIKESPSILGFGVLLAFETGLRCGELSTIKWSDVEDNLLAVTRTEISFDDGNKKQVYQIREFPKTPAGIRKVVLSNKAKSILKEIRKRNPFGEFIFMKNGARIKGKAFTGKLYRICEKLNITKRSLHKARMTYATRLIDARLPDALVIDQMGHTDIKTTKEYYYHCNKTNEEAIRAVQTALSS